MTGSPMWIVAMLCFLIALGGFLPGTLRAQQTFGTASEIAHVVGAWEFETLTGTTDGITLTGRRFCSSVGGCDFFASLRLPSGARVTRIALDACDKNASFTGLTFAQMIQLPSPAGTGPTSTLATVDTGPDPTATPGCAIFSESLTSPVTIDNEHFNYLLYVHLIAGDFFLDFTAIRVYYTLQVSPAPGTATFGDVPTSHPFFQFVEALVASGITAGCGGGNYCPDAPLTRGQMAAFLSKALGLHFAP
jgi:hypothetical protein